MVVILQVVFRSLVYCQLIAFLVAEWLALPAWAHKVPGSNAAGGRSQLMTEQCFISQSFVIILPLSQYD